jgi:hypothetical protein
MATAKTTTPDLNDAADQIAKLNERFVEAGKRASNIYLDSYEKLIEGVTSFQQKFADRSQDDTIKSVVSTQADLKRQLASAYSSVAREVIA